MSENESTLKVIRYDIKYHRPATTLRQLSCGLTEAEGDLELMPENDVIQVDKAWQAFLTHCEKNVIFTTPRVVNNAVCFSVFINARSKRSFDKKIEAAGFDIMGKSSPVPLKAAFWRVNGSTLGMDVRPDLEERWKNFGFPEDFEPKLEWTKKTLKEEELSQAWKAIDEHIRREDGLFCLGALKLLRRLLGRDANPKEEKFIRFLTEIYDYQYKNIDYAAGLMAQELAMAYALKNGFEKLIIAVDACESPVLPYVLQNGILTVEELNIRQAAVQLKKEKEKIRHELIAVGLDSISKNTESSLWF